VKKKGGATKMVQFCLYYICTPCTYSDYNINIYLHGRVCKGGSVGVGCKKNNKNHKKKTFALQRFISSILYP